MAGLLVQQQTPDIVHQAPRSWEKEDKTPFYKHPHSANQTPVLLTFATGYGAAQLHFFANSFQRWAPWEAKLVFFTEDGLVPVGLVVPRPENVIFVKTSSIILPHNTPSNVTELPVIHRFFLYKTWLENHASDYSTVYLADFRDLFFQGDPFEPITERGVYLFEESVALTNEPFYNQPWIRQCYGNDAVNNLINMKAHPLCGGALAASDVDSLLSLLTVLIKDLLAGCNDQGALTYIGYLTLPQLWAQQEQDPPREVYRLPLEHSWVAHALEEYNPAHPDRHPNTKLAPIETVKQDSLGRLLNSDSRPYAIIHQGDRFSAIWALRHQPIRYLPPNPHRFSFKKPAQTRSKWALKASKAVKRILRQLSSEEDAKLEGALVVLQGLCFFVLSACSLWGVATAARSYLQQREGELRRDS
jgi:hypothetical protein